MARLSRLVLTAAVTAAGFAVPAVAHGDSDVYVVRDGDSLSGIAGRLDVTLPDLLSANGLSVSSLIVPGQRLEVPGGSTSGSAAAPSAGGVTHTVSAGDTLSGIARRYHVSLASLLAANGLNVSSLIVPGQRLQVPGGSSSGAAAEPSSGGGAAAPSSGGVTHTVSAGDTLSGIAVRYHVSLASLLAANRLNVSSLIVPGQRLEVPGGSSSGASATPASGGVTHTVSAGDTLSGIAVRYHVSLASLLAANGLNVSSLITPGMELRLPSGAVASAAPRSSRVNVVVNYALAQLGSPYKFFTAGPYTFDCSGLTLAAYARAGITLVHHSASQSRQGVAVDFRNEPIRPGDLIFLATRGSAVINHVGMAINATTWIQARRPGDVVRLAPIPPRGTIIAVRRLIPAG